MNNFKRPLCLLILLAIAAGCASPGVVFVSRTYDPLRIRRVASLSFADSPGVQGSGEIAAGTFEKYLLWAGYSLVERRQVQEILKEQLLDVSGSSIDKNTIHTLGKLLGVDALVFGNLTEFSNVREHTVFVNIFQEHTEPVYGQIITTRQDSYATVRNIQNVVTGYSSTHTNRRVPGIETLPARVGMSVRLVDVETGEVIWSATASSEGVDLTAAAEESSSKIMQAVVRQLKKPTEHLVP